MLIKIHNAATGEVIEREMTADEIAELENEQNKAQININALAQKQAAKLSDLEKLGLTEEEAKAFLGQNNL